MADDDVTLPLPCLVCGTQLECAFGDQGPSYIPYRGTLFLAHGNYGSTVFDPNFFGGGPWLEIVICDLCLQLHADERVHFVTPPVTIPQEADRKLWDPETDARQ